MNETDEGTDVGAAMRDAMSELLDATLSHREAAAKWEAARADETRCINRLNAAQKAFDEVAAAVRKRASQHGSIWNQQACEQRREAAR